MLPPGGCRAAEALLPTAQDRPSVRISRYLQRTQTPSNPLTGILAQAFAEPSFQSWPLGVGQIEGLSPDRQPRRASIFPGCSGFLTSWITARRSLRHPR